MRSLSALRRALCSTSPRGRKMAAGGQLSSVPEVAMDPDGTFKYILVRVQRGADEHRDIVRGTADAEFHNHIFEKVNPEMEKLGFVCKCLGGGKIDHNSKDKKIRVFGLSTGYGKADHSVTVEILKRIYKDYEISWSDDKK
ncbi:14 kDa phosphohistidine phosphatase-like [Thamnophis elegans]|uniref:14 kDa phosphohistidine phosphatase-like n=1 Tax=Thamnophis elegans TaxID=35005 RepID=UPI001377A637|nr:14 kDa phosphohistidine phosphatase-like [Thamnophis elegans]